MTPHARLGCAATILTLSGVYLVLATAALVVPFLLVMAAIAGVMHACRAR